MHHISICPCVHWLRDNPIKPIPLSFIYSCLETVFLFSFNKTILSLVCVCSHICKFIVKFVKVFAIRKSLAVAFCMYSIVARVSFVYTLHISRCFLETLRQSSPSCFCSFCLFPVLFLLVLHHVSVCLLSFSPVPAPFPWTFCDHDAVCPVPCSSAPGHCGE